MRGFNPRELGALGPLQGLLSSCDTSGNLPTSSPLPVVTSPRDLVVMVIMTRDLRLRDRDVIFLEFSCRGYQGMVDIMIRVGLE